MNLAQHVSDLIDQDLSQLREEHANQLHALQLEQDAALQTDRSQYQEQIAGAVEQQVNQRHYQAKQTVSFDYATTLRQRIDEAYLASTEQLLGSEFGATALKTVLKSVPQATPLTVSGTHAQLLESLVRSLGYTAVQRVEGTGLGALRYEVPPVIGEFLVEEFLESVKKKTINQLMNGLS